MASETEDALARLCDRQIERIKQLDEQRTVLLEAAKQVMIRLCADFQAHKKECFVKGRIALPWNDVVALEDAIVKAEVRS